MLDPTYLTIVADKRAELDALAALPKQWRASVLPLVELRNPSPPKNAPPSWTPEAALKKRLIDEKDGIVGCWGTEDEILIDGRRLNAVSFEGGIHPVDFVMQWCAAAGIRAVVVTDRQLPADYRRLAAQWARKSDGRAAIRLRGQDLYAGSDGTAVLLRELDLPKRAIDLVLDFCHVDPNSAITVAQLAVECLRKLAPLSSWKSVSLVGGSFPVNLSQVMDYNQLEIFSRAERTIWHRVDAGLHGNTRVQFGDYGIVTAGDSDGVAFRGSANLRYATANSWLVKRGLKSTVAPPNDYARLCGELVADATWRGADHCPGCRFLSEKAQAGSGGNPTQYRSAGFIHHYTVVAEDLGLIA